MLPLRIILSLLPLFSSVFCPKRKYPYIENTNQVFKRPSSRSYLEELGERQQNFDESGHPISNYHKDQKNLHNSGGSFVIIPENIMVSNVEDAIFKKPSSIYFKYTTSEHRVYSSKVLEDDVLNGHKSQNQGNVSSADSYNVIITSILLVPIFGTTVSMATRSIEDYPWFLYAIVLINNFADRKKIFIQSPSEFKFKMDFINSIISLKEIFKGQFVPYEYALNTKVLCYNQRHSFSISMLFLLQVLHFTCCQERCKEYRFLNEYVREAVNSLSQFERFTNVISEIIIYLEFKLKEEFKPKRDFKHAVQQRLCIVELPLIIFIYFTKQDNKGNSYGKLLEKLWNQITSLSDRETQKQFSKFFHWMYFLEIENIYADKTKKESFIYTCLDRLNTLISSCQEQTIDFNTNLCGKDIFEKFNFVIDVLNECTSNTNLFRYKTVFENFYKIYFHQCKIYIRSWFDEGNQGNINLDLHDEIVRNIFYLKRLDRILEFSSEIKSLELNKNAGFHSKQIDQVINQSQCRDYPDSKKFIFSQECTKANEFSRLYESFADASNFNNFLLEQSQHFLEAEMNLVAVPIDEDENNLFKTFGLEEPYPESDTTNPHMEDEKEPLQEIYIREITSASKEVQELYTDFQKMKSAIDNYCSHAKSQNEDSYNAIPNEFKLKISTLALNNDFDYQPASSSPFCNSDITFGKLLQFFYEMTGNYVDNEGCKFFDFIPRNSQFFETTAFSSNSSSKITVREKYQRDLHEMFINYFIRVF